MAHTVSDVFGQRQSMTYDCQCSLVAWRRGITPLRVSFVCLPGEGIDYLRVVSERERETKRKREGCFD